MMSEVPFAIPYERQSDAQAQRGCGAACLSMIYGSLGLRIPPAEIWPAIAKVNRFGSLCSTTHLMVQHALSRGFAALAVQARHPLQVLQLSRDSGIRTILNLRLGSDSPAGHYAVLVDVGKHDVVLHDPLYGPFRRLPHAELLKLWWPNVPDSEITGYVLVGVAPRSAAAAPCWLCRAPMPSHVACPNCRKPVGTQPSALLGCMNQDCLVRTWNYLCCPSCDYTWSFSVPAAAPGDEAPAAVGGAGAPASGLPDRQAAAAIETGALNLDKLFAELDRFRRHVLGLPEAARHPDLKKHLDFMARSQERIKLAQAEALVHRNASQQQLARLAEMARQNEQAHAKRVEEANRPSPPLDGDALGHAWLRNLGLL